MALIMGEEEEGREEGLFIENVSVCLDEDVSLTLCRSGSNTREMDGGWRLEEEREEGTIWQLGGMICGGWWVVGGDGKWEGCRQ